MTEREDKQSTINLLTLQMSLYVDPPFLSCFSSPPPSSLPLPLLSPSLFSPASPCFSFPPPSSLSLPSFPFLFPSLCLFPSLLLFPFLVLLLISTPITPPPPSPMAGIPMVSPSNDMIVVFMNFHYHRRKFQNRIVSHQSQLHGGK